MKRQTEAVLIFAVGILVGCASGMVIARVLESLNK